MYVVTGGNYCSHIEACIPSIEKFVMKLKAKMLLVIYTVVIYSKMINFVKLGFSGIEESI